MSEILHYNELNFHR